MSLRLGQARQFRFRIGVDVARQQQLGKALILLPGAAQRGHRLSMCPKSCPDSDRFDVCSIALVLKDQPRALTAVHGTVSLGGGACAVTNTSPNAKRFVLAPSDPDPGDQTMFGDRFATADIRRTEQGFVSLESLDLELRERTARHDREPDSWLSVRVLHLPPGLVRLEQCQDLVDGCVGILILDGLMIVELHEGRGRIGWLVGDDDVLRPWELQEISLTRTAEWRALKPTRIALLDEQFTLRTGHSSQIVRGLLTRSARTTQWLLAKSLIASSPLLEDRLMLMFALLGERWGRVAADGILLDLPLTHNSLATLCGARRPPVTLALGALREEGTVIRLADGRWLLRRSPPAPGCVQHWSWQAYAEALGFAA